MSNISRILVVILALGAVGSIGGGLGHLLDSNLVTACLNEAFACQ